MTNSNIMKILFLILMFLISICNLHSIGVKVYEYNNIIFSQLEKGEDDYYYFIGSFNDKEYIGFSPNGVENIKTIYFDSVTIEGAILKNKPLKPSSIKFINNNLYIGFDNSTVIKFDKDLNPLDTFKLGTAFQTIDKMIEYKNSILVSCFYSGLNDFSRKIFYLENDKFIELSNFPVSFFDKSYNIYTYNNYEIYFNANSFVQIGDTNLLLQKIFSTKDFGLTWDSLDITGKTPNNYHRYVHKYSDNHYLLRSDFKKYPYKPSWLQYISAVTIIKNGKERFIELDTIGTTELSTSIYVSKKINILFGTGGFININEINENTYKFDTIRFKNYVDNLNFISSAKVISDDNRKLYFTGLSNQILELDLDVLLSIEDVNNYFKVMPPYPNPTRREVTAKFYWDSRIDIDNSDISVFDLNGNKVSGKENLTLEKLNEWSGNIKWNSTGQPSGTYLIKIQHGNNTKTVKVVVN